MFNHQYRLGSRFCVNETSRISECYSAQMQAGIRGSIYLRDYYFSSRTLCLCPYLLYHRADFSVGQSGSKNCTVCNTDTISEVSSHLCTLVLTRKMNKNSEWLCTSSFLSEHFYCKHFLFDMKRFLLIFPPCQEQQQHSFFNDL